MTESSGDIHGCPFSRSNVGQNPTAGCIGDSQLPMIEKPTYVFTKVAKSGDGWDTGSWNPPFWRDQLDKTRSFALSVRLPAHGCRCALGDDGLLVSRIHVRSRDTWARHEWMVVGKQRLK